MTRISSVTGGFAGYSAMSRSFAPSGGGGGQDPNEYNGATMLFAQTSAPLGWTKDTTYNDYALRVSSGAMSSGGTLNFSSVYATVTPSGTVSGVSVSGLQPWTLSAPQLPAHTHPYYGFPVAYNVTPYVAPAPSTTVDQIQSKETGPAGTPWAGGSHTHPSVTLSSVSFNGTSVNLSVKYVDFILASK